MNDHEKGPARSSFCLSSLSSHNRFAATHPHISLIGTRRSARTCGKQSLLKSSGVIAIFFAFASPASAQRTGDNAQRSAEDAFGSSIGNESIGLYSPSSVRGFSPFAAGNVRLEGLYYDASVGFNGRLIRGSTVRVGISAQGYLFPAPTGIADYRLRIPRDEPALSLVATADSYGGIYFEADGQIPIVKNKLALGLGAHVSDDAFNFSGGGVHSSAAAIVRWRPTETLEVLPFWSGFIHHGMDTQPAVFIESNGDFLPPKMERGRYFAQPWTRYTGHDVNYGTIVRWRSGGIAIATGIFRSVVTTEEAYSDLFTEVSREGVSRRHIVSASPPQKYGSTSGELRGSYSLREGRRSHTFQVAARARERKRRYGGSSLADLGPVGLDDVAPVPAPAFTFGEYTRDKVKQLSGGVGYEGRWAGIGELTLGIQRVQYQKDVTRPGQTDPATKASPWLYNGGASVSLSPSFALYGGVTRGLEESPIAPSTAVNRDEAPPAILTRQYDGGVRWRITPKVRLVAGLFNVEKPYFGLDSARVYRRLGEVQHRGMELSVVGEVTPQLNLLAGVILLDAQVSGESVESGSIGRRPVASTGRNLLVSADYRLPQVPGLSVNVSISSVGKRVANAANTVFVPTAETVNLGMRYRTRVGETPVTLRVQGTNIFNKYIWNVFPSGALAYNDQRQLSVILSADL